MQPNTICIAFGQCIYSASVQSVLSTKMYPSIFREYFVKKNIHTWTLQFEDECYSKSMLTLGIIKTSLAKKKIGVLWNHCAKIVLWSDACTSLDIRLLSYSYSTHTVTALRSLLLVCTISSCWQSFTSGQISFPLQWEQQSTNNIHIQL